MLELGTPATLFAVSERASWGDFAVSPDGQRFLSISYESRGSEQPSRSSSTGLQRPRGDEAENGGGFLSPLPRNPRPVVGIVQLHVSVLRALVRSVSPSPGRRCLYWSGSSRSHRPPAK